jgi:hypothetical protein
LYQSLDAGGVSSWRLQGWRFLHEPTVRWPYLAVYCLLRSYARRLTLSKQNKKGSNDKNM